MIRKVNAAVLFVEDLTKMMAFYQDILGLKVVFSDDVSYAFHMEGQDFALVEVAAGVEMLNEEVLGVGRGAGHRVMLCADIEDVDAFYKSLTGKGLAFIKPPIDQPWGWRCEWILTRTRHARLSTLHSQRY